MPRQRQRVVRDTKSKVARREDLAGRAGTELLAHGRLGPVEDRLVHSANAGLRAQLLAALQRRCGNADLQSRLGRQQRPILSGEEGRGADLLAARAMLSIQQRMPVTALARRENEEDEPSTEPAAPSGPETTVAAPPPPTPAPEAGPTTGPQPTTPTTGPQPTPPTTATPPAAPVPAAPASPLATAVTTAERRAIAPSAPWAQLPPAERTVVVADIRGGRGHAAVTRLWNALVATGTLAQAGRVTVEPVTADRLGFVGGHDLRLGPLTTAVALSYVPRQPACATTSPADHPQLHQAGQIRTLIQVNTDAVTGTPEEMVSQLHSLLMHEYTHAEQAMERGMLPGMVFRPVGDREFFFENEVAQPERGVLEMLDEIEAYASEIEQAERTGLAVGSNLRTVVCELWDKYLRYRDRTRQHPNPSVAARVRQAIEQGRTLYRQYVATRTGHLPPRLRSFALSLQDCPPRYDPSLF